jgi:hypothetical protein
MGRDGPQEVAIEEVWWSMMAEVVGSAGSKLLSAAVCNGSQHE